jgi:DUF1680 family protein
MSDPRHGYVTLAGTWKAGQKVEIELEMPVEHVRAHPAVSADQGRACLMRGPLVYCLEGVDHDVDPRRIQFTGRGFSARWEPDTLGGVVVLRGLGETHDAADWEGRLYAAEGERNWRKVPVTAVPYYAWDNRAAGPMAVWLPKL